uniref:Neutral cholesterol ester hydrolase 1b, tandem duplicate 1 n=1 Tax=Sinocyclocheilus grahami TaxID=75366 RepID=A0A672KWS1_SINGR
MRPVLIGTVLLSIAAAYYIYLPLPSTISEPWKLMFMDALIRGMMKLSFLAHDLGLTSPFGLAKYYSAGAKSIESSPSVRVTEACFGGVEALVFESAAAGQEQSFKRGVVYFHGGGWTLDSTRTKETLLRYYLKGSYGAFLKIIIWFRITSSPRFTKRYNDVFQASKHILTSEVLGRYSIDLKRVAVSGDSAGGNLAAAVAQQVALDSSIPIKFKVQALVYPALQALDFNTPSYQQNANMPILDRPMMARFWLEYLNGEQKLVPALLANNHTALDQGQEIAAAKAKTDWTKLLPVAFQKSYKPVFPLHGDPKLLEKLPGLLDVRAAPLLAETKVLKAVPPAYIMTCEHDVLRDDGLMYATRLEEAGVDVTVDHFEDGFHGCLSFAFGPFAFSVGRRSLGNYIHWLKENL